jgi:hypothetical protein
LEKTFSRLKGPRFLIRFSRLLSLCDHRV